MVYSSNIQEFRDTFYNIQRPNRYSVSVNVPKPLKSFDDLYAQSITIPGRETLHHLDEIWGPPRLVPIKREFKSAIIINFIIDEGWGLRNYFESWMDTIIDPQTNMRKDYTFIHDSSLTIQPLGGDDSPGTTITVKEVYPHTIMPLNMSHDMINTFTTMQVSFAYREYSAI